MFSIKSTHKSAAGPIAVFAAGCALAFLLLVLFESLIVERHGKVQRASEDRLTSVSTVVAGHASQSLNAADLVLRGVVDRANALPVRNQSEFRRHFGTGRQFESLQDAARGAPQIEVLTIVDLNGEVVNFSREYPTPAINLADRDYFIDHMRNPATDFVISAPVRNRSNGRWTFYLARKIRGVDGAMAGLVLAGLKCDFFSEFYGTMYRRLSDFTALFRADGVLLSRYPFDERLLGVSFANSTSFKEILANKASGVTLTRAFSPGYAGDLRMIAARRLYDFPVAVVAGELAENIFEQWRKSAYLAGALGLLLVGAVLAGTVWSAQYLSLLQRAKVEAETVSDLKSKFVSVVSHELRTPLNAIIGGTELLMQPTASVDAAEILKVISTSSRYLMALINEILDFSKLDARRSRLEIAPFELRHIVDDAMAISRPQPGAKALKISARIDPQTPTFLIGDAGRISQIIVNLLGNAVKFTDAGSVTLDVRPMRFGEMPGVQLAVSDTGIGIPSDVQRRLFLPFEQGGGATSKVAAGGTGLGLAICKRLVDLMGGTIRVDSEIGKGSTFSVCLPLAATSTTSETLSKIETYSLQPNQGLRVLIAEDVAASRLILEKMLEKLGCYVRAVTDGAEAVDTAVAEEFDLVLMDNQMPELDGAEATRRIRAALGETSTLRIVGVTAGADKAVHEELLAAGMDDVIIKPIRADLLAATIRTACDLRMDALIAG